MTVLHVMCAVNVMLLVIVGGFCVKYEIPAKLVSRITHGGGGIIDPVKTERYTLQLDVFRNAPRGDEAIVMLGDSLTENTPFCELLGFRHRIRNRGISSDNTRGVLHRIDETASLNAAKVFILLGINDIGNGISQSETLSNYRQIVQRLKASSGEVYIQSVLPVDHKKLADNARCRRRTREAITSLNAELRRLADELGCEFVDTYSVFAGDDGEMDDACTFDGLHLNGHGMMKWCNFLEQYM